MPEQLGQDVALSAADDGDRTVDFYLAEIAARLPCPRRYRGDLLAELRDGLVDAVDHYRAQGLPPRTAAAHAVDDCGPVEVVSRACAELLAERHARRSAVTLLVTGPLIGGLWLATLVPGDTPDALLLATPLLGILVGIAVLAAALAVAATGRLGTLLPGAIGLAPKAAGTACVTMVIADASILGTATVQGLTAPSGLPWVLGLTAAAASCIRLACSQHAARHHLRRVCTDPGSGRC